MTDDLQKLLDEMPEVDFDKEPVETSGGGNYRFFGNLKLYQIPVIPFQSGQKMEIPGIYDWKWNAETKTFVNNGLKQFSAMRPGKSKADDILYVLVHERVTSTGLAYQAVKHYHTWKDKDRENVWIKFQHEALKGIPVNERKKLHPKAGGLECGLDEIPTGQKYNDGDIKFFGNFTTYPDKASRQAAEKEHFAQFEKGGASNGSVVDESNFPFTWKKPDGKLEDGQLLYQMIRDGLAAGKTPLAVAQEVSCLQQPGNKPGLRLDGETPLDLAKLFGKATGQPAEMFTF